MDEVTIRIDGRMCCGPNYIFRVGVNGQGQIEFGRVKLKGVDDGRKFGCVIGALPEER